VNKSSFEKSSYGRFHEQAGASRIRRQANISLESKVALEIASCDDIQSPMFM